MVVVRLDIFSQVDNKLIDRHFVRLDRRWGWRRCRRWQGLFGVQDPALFGCAGQGDVLNVQDEAIGGCAREDGSLIYLYRV